MKKILALTGAVLLFSMAQLFAVTIDESVSGVDRYAVYVGANYGGKSRERLLYAGSDALSFKQTMTEIGGVTESQSLLLIDPTKDSIDNALQTISDQINAKSGHSKRSEFIFYYSGHSDENALLLGDSKYDYSKLKAAISDVPSDIHVVILDSCYSGNFIRTKGGQKRKPFLIDDSSVVTGHAYLSSSSDNESSQESDEIESSFFTNAMITGLRGAADTSGDNKVTLNELYSYAFNDTLSKTETSKAGPQHPNFNITLVGSGDLILSDLTNGEAMLSLTKEAKGKFIIRDGNDKLVSEINKSAGQPITMALPSGQYSATIIDEYSSRQGVFYLNKDQNYILDSNSLSTIKRKNARLRGNNQPSDEEAEYKIEDVSDDDDVLSLYGLTKKENTKAETDDDGNINEGELDIDLVEDEDDEEIEEDFIKAPRFDFDFSNLDFGGFTLSLVPGFTLVEAGSDLINAAVGIFGSKVNNLYGVQFSDLINIGNGKIVGAQIAHVGNITRGKQAGAQFSGVFNITELMTGAQFASTFNIASYISGAQSAGLFNISKRTDGLQDAGLFNYTKRLNGLQIAGLGNIANSVDGAQVSGLINIAKTINGPQIGLINVADENNGITIGLLNFIGNGLFDFAVTWNTDDMIEYYLQEGARNLYTVIGAAYSRKSIGDDDNKYGAFFYGLGTQFRFGKASLEAEFLHKLYFFGDDEEFTDLNRTYKGFSITEKIAQISVPTLRFNLNFLESKYFSAFGSCSFDFNIVGHNDTAFQIYERNICIEDDDVNIYTSFSIGAKFKL